MKPIYFEDQDKTYNQDGDLMIGASERNYLDRINKKTCNLLEEKDMNYLKIIVEKETHIIDLEAELEKYKHMSISQRCRETLVQNCHICEDFNCGDNITDGAKQIKKYKKVVDAAKILMQGSNHLVVEWQDRLKEALKGVEMKNEICRICRGTGITYGEVELVGDGIDAVIEAVEYACPKCSELKESEV